VRANCSYVHAASSTQLLDGSALQISARLAIAAAQPRLLGWADEVPNLHAAEAAAITTVGGIIAIGGDLSALSR
jgi:hypothetical protein